jgi:excisionase family DNA binding protein
MQNRTAVPGPADPRGHSEFLERDQVRSEARKTAPREPDPHATSPHPPLVPFTENLGAGADPVRPEPVLLTIGELSQLLRVSERTIRRRIKDGTLRKVPLPGRLVRVTIAELQDLLGTRPRKGD